MMVTLKLILLSLLFAGCAEQNTEPSIVLSLDQNEFGAKKYYLGWGVAMDGDPGEMHNQVLYDVKHTHDIFTSAEGGSYQGKVITRETGYVSGQAVNSAWREIGSAIKPADMFVQYSSGHGYEQGLAIDISYEDIRNNALSYGARETVIFTMACHSGGLVNSFDQRRSEWQNFDQQGKTLFVMSSSSVNTLSAGGPGSDGTAGSAFGYALWQTMSGKGDGYYDGFKDGFVSLGEIATHTTALTNRVGGHTPVFTGSYNPQLIMNRNPSGQFMQDAIGGSPQDPNQVKASIRAADAYILKKE